jgi:hypothetical protein
LNIYLAGFQAGKTDCYGTVDTRSARLLSILVGCDPVAEESATEQLRARKIRRSGFAIFMMKRLLGTINPRKGSLGGITDEISLADNASRTSP